MEIVNHIKYDIAKREVAQVIYAVQGEENSRVIELSLFANGSAFDVSGSVCSLAFKKPDGTSGWYDTMPDGGSAYSVTENVVSIKIAPQVLTVEGEVNSVIRIESADNAERATTFPIIIDVSADPAIDAPESENYYKVQNWDEVNVALALAVSYDPQPEVTEAQKAHARDNIGAADAKELADINDNLNGLTDIPFTFIDGYYVKPTTGALGTYQGYSYTDFIAVSHLAKIQVYVGAAASNTGLAFYKVNTALAPGESYGNDFVSGIDFGEYSIGDCLTIDVPEDALYMRVCTLNANKEKFFVRALDMYGMGIKLFNKAEQIAADVRAEIGENTKQLTNLFSYDIGELIVGLVNNWGNIGTATSYVRTDYLVLHGTTVAFPAYFSDSAGYTFFDENKEWVAGGKRTTENLGDIIEIEVPAKAKYLMVSCLATQKDNFFVRVTAGLMEHLNSIIDPAPCDYPGNEFLTFRKILCIGDSLTEGQFDYYDAGTRREFNSKVYAYPTYLKAMTGAEVTNAGDAGESTRTWYEKHANDDLSGHDCAIIALGLNDSNGSTSVQTTSEERTTALGNIVAKLKAENKGIKIFISTIFKCFTGSEKIPVNTDIINFANTTDDVYLMDLFTHGNVINKPWYVAGHLTAYGYRQLAGDIFAYASYIMHNDPESFRFVQYIGTDYAYQ